MEHSIILYYRRMWESVIYGLQTKWSSFDLDWTDTDQLVWDTKLVFLWYWSLDWWVLKCWSWASFPWLKVQYLSCAGSWAPTALKAAELLMELAVLMVTWISITVHSSPTDKMWLFYHFSMFFLQLYRTLLILFLNVLLGSVPCTLG